MAGLGEACSHIAALLFTLEKSTRHQQNTTCTSLPCAWLPPSYQAVSYSKIAGIDFITTRLKSKRSKSDPNLTSNPATPKSNPTENEVFPPSDVELATFYEHIFQQKKLFFSLLCLDVQITIYLYVQVVFCLTHLLNSSAVKT